MPVRIVQSKQNSRLKELRRVLASPGRDGTLVAIEGPNLIAEALRARAALHCVFGAQGDERAIENLHLVAATEVLLFPREALASALTTETPQPIAALLAAPQWTWEDLLPNTPRKPPLIVVLAGLQDPGNLGTILRSAEAFGATGIISLPGTVHPWNSKAVRASAGSIFRVPILSASVPDAITHLRKSDVMIYAATARAAQPAVRVGLNAPVALIIGNEGNGIPDEITALADGAITIPCPGPVESLNAAVAASVLLYEAASQRGGARETPKKHRGAP
jgi:RNA methyltransferase, TrmH family